MDAPEPTPVVAALVLAAGSATRFGGPKQLARVDGKPLVQHAVDAAHGGGAAGIVVVLGAKADEIERELALPANARIVRNPDYAAGQSTSLRAGLNAVTGDSAAVVVLLADQPGVTADDVAAVISEHAESGAVVVQASYRGVQGHPVLFVRRLFPQLLAASGDEGARGILRAHAANIREAAIDRDPPGDVDTPDDLRALGGEPPAER